MEFTTEQLKFLNRWIIIQRMKHKKNNLSKYRIKKLNEINFIWQIIGIHLLKDSPLFKEIHPTKNKEIDLNKLSIGCNKKVWWLGKCGHEWQAIITSRNRNIGKGCPFCSGQKVCKENCLATLNPELAKEWHPTKNGTLTPNGVTVSSGKKVWWLGKCGHEWQVRISHRKNGNKCPFCRGLRIDKTNCLATLNPELAKEWHSTKNGTLTPNDVTIGSGKKVWWKCLKKGHEWETTISNRTLGNGCPFCSGRFASKENCLKISNLKLAKEWHPTKNGTLTPNDVTIGSGKKVWWKCLKKGHEWKLSPNKRIKKNKIISCPFCRGLKVCKDNCLATKHPNIAKMWNSKKNGKITVFDVTEQTTEKFHFITPKGNNKFYSPNYMVRYYGKS